MAKSWLDLRFKKAYEVAPGDGIKMKVFLRIQKDIIKMFVPHDVVGELSGAHCGGSKLRRL